MKAAHPRTDDNQKAIVDELRRLGYSVQSLASVGEGCPDIICGWRGKNYCFELKSPGPPSSRRLTPDQLRWHTDWQGQVSVIETVEQALRAMES